MQNALLGAQHFGSFGGLIQKLRNLIVVVQQVLKGNSGAMIAICLILRNVVFSWSFATSTFASAVALFIILNMVKCESPNWGHQILNTRFVFICFLNAPIKPWQPLACLSKTHMGRGALDDDSIVTTPQLHFDCCGKLLLPHAAG